ncbi:darcynin family protein [Tropicibacter sp. S64]|uniref:darcynin family protein n=1 Tax=Tropicibacter sp. S64 TaxID=3415122 RepID=UPI003C7EAECC
MQLTVFLMLMATPEWLALDRLERARLSGSALDAAFADTTVSFRFYDAEAFSARVSDVMVITADTARDYYFVIERLRDTALIAHRYFQIVEIVPAFENGFREFEAAG